MPYPEIGPPAFAVEPSAVAPYVATKEAAKLRTTEGGVLEYRLSRGDWESSTAADQAVALSLGIQRGDIPSAPEVGNELHLVVPGLPTTQTSVEDAISRAYPLSELLARKIVETLAIKSDSGPNGRLLVEYSYKLVGDDENRKAFYRG